LAGLFLLLLCVYGHEQINVAVMGVPCLGWCSRSWRITSTFSGACIAPSNTARPRGAHEWLIWAHAKADAGC
jgi:hypothetical protein